MFDYKHKENGINFKITYFFRKVTLYALSKRSILWIRNVKDFGKLFLYEHKNLRKFSNQSHGHLKRGTNMGLRKIPYGNTNIIFKTLLFKIVFVVTNIAC